MKLNKLFYKTNGDKFKRLESLKEIIINNKLDNICFTIIIAGTNGKGSTANYLNSILKNVGLFTSPHLYKVNERIKINNKEISDNDFQRIYFIYEKECLKKNLNFFDVILLISLHYFKECKCKYIILESGIGGLYDSTNLLSADISVITNIGYDHKEILGDTLEKIAFQKAGIIKENKIIFTAEENDNIFKIIQNEAKAKKATIKRCIPNIKNYGQRYYFNNFSINNNVLYQTKNAYLASEVAQYLNIDAKDIQSGLDKAYWPCRFEKIYEKPNIYLDGAHNIDGFKVLIKELEFLDNPVMLLGFLKYKNYKEIIKLLNEKKITYYLTTFDNEAALDKKALESLGEYVRFESFIKSNQNDLVIAGSFYFINTVNKKRISSILI